MASDKYIWTEEGRLHTVYKNVSRANNVFTQIGHNIRVNETVHISDGAAKRQGVVTAVDADTFTVAAYKNTSFTALATTGLTVFVYGSEFRKGTKGMQGSPMEKYGRQFADGKDRKKKKSAKQDYQDSDLGCSSQSAVPYRLAIALNSGRETICSRIIFS